MGLRAPSGPNVTASWLLTGYVVVLLGVGVLVWRRRRAVGFMPRRQLAGAFASRDGHPLQSRSLLMPIVLHTLIDLRVFVLLPAPADAGKG